LTFLKSRPANYVLGNTGTSEDQAYSEKRQKLLMERKVIEERTLSAVKRSLGLVHESEKVGLATAEELVRQGEKLNNIDSNLDSMNSTMRATQKHLTSMKSLFGGIKGYFSKSDATPAPTGTNGSGTSPHPGYQSHLTDTLSSNKSKGQASFTSDISQTKTLNDGSHKTTASRSREMDQALDGNLSELGLGLGRLKNMAIGLGTEIESQNDLIERIMMKEERAEETMGYQNRQMRQILKK